MPPTAKDVSDLIATVENLAPGEPWAPAARLAEQALTEFRAGALDALFPAELPALDGPAFAALAWHERRFPPGLAYGQAMAKLHGKAIASSPALATLIRSAEV